MFQKYLPNFSDTQKLPKFQVYQHFTDSLQKCQENILSDKILNCITNSITLTRKVFNMSQL